MEEIRAQMKSGSSQFESHLKDLSKGITVTADDMKKRTEDEKKKMIIDSVSGVFSKADEAKARFNKRREEETEKELAKIEADKNLKRKAVVQKPKEAATNVATRRRKSLAELQARKEQQAAAATAARSGDEPKEAAVPAAKPGPKGDGAAATKIRNALANATNVRKPESPSPKPEGEKQMKRYATRRKTQEIVNESAEPKIKKRKQMYKRNRFIRNPHDIDMEQMFFLAAKDRINRPPQKKQKRGHGSKIWISDLTDIDKIYKASEIRDIIASAN
ncbi:hypothetical protein TELCIR_17736, partial [Teladorsagia circumcincta]